MCDRPGLLLDLALIHDDDIVGNHQRLALVVGDIDRGDAELTLDAAEFELHFFAQLAVERSQRLVEKQQVGLEHQRARNRDTLLLPAGQLVNAAAAVASEPHQREISLDPVGNGACIEPAHLQREGDILGRRHMRKQARVSERPCRSTACAVAPRSPLRR